MAFLKAIIKLDDESQGAFEARIRLRRTWSGLLGFISLATSTAIGVVHPTPVVGVIAIILIALSIYLMERVWYPARAQLRHEQTKKENALIKDILSTNEP